MMGLFLGNLRKAPSFKEALLAFTPSFSNFDLKAVGFIVLVGIGWWSFAPSNGYFVQRMLATKSEKDSLFALLWFNIAHYILRPWPWIIVGLASMYYLPNLVDAESAYPTMVNMFLPIGLKGLMVASLFAAFMSTTDTHLNWGTSYIINDLYQPFVRPGKEAKHYIKTSRIVMAVLSFITLVVATRLTGILSTFQIIYNVMGGVSLVMILRWYWWRVNVFSEISALLSSAIMTIALEGVASLSGPELYPIRLLINTGVTTTIWVTVTFLTSKQPAAQAIAFYEHMKISGPGWQRVKKLTGVKPIAGEFRENVIATITTLVFLYSLLIGIGKLIFADYTVASICLVFTILSAFNLRRVMRQMHISDAKIEG